MATNTTLLAKGLRNLGFLVLLFIASPIALTISYKALESYADDKLYIAYILLVFSALLMFFTFYFAFKTFKILLNAIFDS